MITKYPTEVVIEAKISTEKGTSRICSVKYLFGWDFQLAGKRTHISPNTYFKKQNIWEITIKLILFAYLINDTSQRMYFNQISRCQTMKYIIWNVFLFYICSDFLPACRFGQILNPAGWQAPNRYFTKTKEMIVDEVPFR